MSSGSIFGKYEVIRRLAAGGMGEIYLGRQVGIAGFERLVIMKTLLPQLSDDPEMVASFLDEARILGSISHPNVVALFEVGEHEGQFIMVMEHIHGLDIPQLRRSGAHANKLVPPRVSAEIIRQAALGIDAAHRAKDARGAELRVVHRDISPSNLMVRADGNVKVLDFGVARAERKQSKTSHGQLKGKVPYMSPEQVRSENIDARHDQWSLGVVFWEMLAQRKLFKNDDVAALFKMILGAKLEAPSTLQPDVPPELDAVVMCLLDRDRERRFPSMNDVALALRAALEALDAPAEEVPRYITEIAGARLAQDLERLVSAGPAGLQPTLHRKSCERCGHEQPPSNRFCAACGHRMEGSRSESRAAPSTPGAVAAPAAMPAPEAALAPRDVSLPEMTAQDTLEVPELPPDEVEEVVAAGDATVEDGARPTEGLAPVPPTTPDLGAAPPSGDATARMPRARRPATVAFARLLGDRIRPEAVAALKAAAEARGAKAATLDGGRLVVVFEGEEREERGADLALGFALAASSTLAPLDSTARVALAHGMVTRGALGFAGQVVDDAEALAAGIDEPGVVVAREVPTSRRLARGRRVSSELEAVELVGGPSSRPEPTLVGRDDLLRQLAAVAEDADRGLGTLLSLTGAPGTGKSALLNEAGALLSWKGMLVARASASLRAAAPPLDVIRQLARSLLLQMAAEQRDTPGLPSVDGGLAATGFVPAECARLRQWFTARPAAEPTPLLQRSAALRGSLARVFVHAAEHYGLGVLIDDAHLLDGASRAFLDALAQRLRSARALVVVAVNPQQGAPALTGARPLRVGPLPDDAILALVEDNCGPLHPELAGLIRAEAAGNPRAALHTAGLLAADQLMQHDGTRWVPTSRGARRRAGSAEALLPKLSPTSRRQLAEAAVAGGALNDDPALLAAVDDAAALWLVPPRVGGRPAPLSPTLQRALLDDAQRSGPQALAELHAAAAARVERHLGDDPAALDQLAWHRRRSGSAGQGVAELLQALARGAALGVVEPLLELGPALCAALAGGQLSAEDSGALDVVAAVLEAALSVDAHAVVAQADTVLAALPRAHRSAGMARVLRMRAHALGRTGQMDAAVPPLVSAVATANAVAAPALAALALVDLGRAAEARGEADAALTAYADATALGAGTGPGEEAAVWLAPLGTAALLAHRGRAADVRDALETAEARAEGDPWGVSALCSVRAGLPGTTADEALRQARDAVVAADQSADITLQVAARHTLARGQAALGHPDDARQTLLGGAGLAADALLVGGQETLRRALAELDRLR